MACDLTPIISLLVNCAESSSLEGRSGSSTESMHKFSRHFYDLSAQRVSKCIRLYLYSYWYLAGIQPPGGIGVHSAKSEAASTISMCTVSITEICNGLYTHFCNTILLLWAVH